MTVPTLDELLRTWTRRAVGARAFSSPALEQAALRLLADGHPATIAEIAKATGSPPDDVRDQIDAAASLGCEVQDGAIVGAALTLLPTAHRFRVSGNDLFTWCGFDAMFLPIMLQERAWVASACPVTGASVRLTIEADGAVSEADPATTAVGIVGEEIVSCCATAGPASDICRQMPFFASQQVGQKWRSNRPGVAVLALDEAQQLARAYAQARIGTGDLEHRGDPGAAPSTTRRSRRPLAGNRGAARGQTLAT